MYAEPPIEEKKEPDLAMKNIIEAVFNIDGTDNKNSHKSSNNSKKLPQYSSSDDFSDDEDILEYPRGKKIPSISDISRHMRKKDWEKGPENQLDVVPSRYELLSLGTHHNYDMNISRNYFQDKDYERDYNIIEKKKSPVKTETSGLSSSNPSTNKQSSEQSIKNSISSGFIFINPDD